MIKRRRISAGLTLRDFCSSAGVSTSYWSKVERGINPPPSDRLLLERLARLFELEGEAKQELLQSASPTLTNDIQGNDILPLAMPAFFPHRLTSTKARLLAKDIIKLHTPDQACA